MRVPPVVLSIAGHDPSSGAGLTADVKTAAALGCYAVTCITALTVQSTQGVFGVQPVAPELVSETLKRLADDFPMAAVRIGMLGSGEVAEAVRRFLEASRLPNVVLDPVVRSSSGAELLDEAGVEALKAMLPLCKVITPNLAEAALLAGTEPASDGSKWDAVLPRLREMAARLHLAGAKAVLITGGHLNPPNDFLSQRSHGGAQEEVFAGEYVESRSTHGTGCALATALACRLALGDELVQAARSAKEFVREAIASAYPLGKGSGPVNPFGGTGVRD
jgi:hydroxymethylpyrimidine/phosphomethylpyrimidine kinase